MDRIPSEPPKIAPLPEGTIRPLWSVMIPVYNCSRFIPDALGCVLRQDPGEEQMQIEVVDDGSTDQDVESLVLEIGKGRVNYYRQPKNIGSLRNFETCINRANGCLIHILHGDDRVSDGFYTNFTETFKEFPEAGAAFCGYSSIDDKGNKIQDHPLVQPNLGLLKGAYLKMASGLPIQFVTMVVKRQVYEKLGSFFGVIAGEDWEMWTRVAKSYPIAFIPKNLAGYRRYTGTISWPKKEEGVYAKSLAKTLFLIESQLPKKDRYVMRITKKRRAISCLSISNYIWHESQNIALIREMTSLALKLDHTSPEVYKKLIKLYFKIIKDSIIWNFREKPVLKEFYSKKSEN